MTDVAIQDPYHVKHGDTLSTIAKASGKTASELKKLNKLPNPNRIEVGQTLYLSRETAFGVSILFLDALRHPIENLRYKINYDGQTKLGQTQTNGAVPRIVTSYAKSHVEVLIQDLHGQWVNVCKVTSDYGHKLVTLKSGAVVFKGETEKHPEPAPAKPVTDKTSTNTIAGSQKAATQTAQPKPVSGAATKNNPNVKTKKTKEKHGQSIIEVGVDIPKGLLEHFTKYTGGPITDQQWADTAKRLDCEPAVLKAFAEVESGGRSSFWRLNKADGAFVPAVLYERHYFSKLTKGQYDSTHRDISWPAPSREVKDLGKTDKKMHDGIVDATDLYKYYAGAYLRLINAYRLNPDAALRSCSWGKFQILGENFALCGARNAKDFVDKMCDSEASQIDLVAEFIRNKPRAWKNRGNKKLGKEISLWDAVKTKNWEAIAFNYNGPNHKNYDIKLKAAYEKYSAKKI